MTRAILPPILFLLATGTCAHAQTSDAKANSEVAAVGAPSTRSVFNPGNALQITAASSASEASFNLSREIGGAGANQRLAVIATAPLDHGTSTFASMDGLAYGTTIELRLENVKLSGATTGTASQALDWCDIHLKPKYERATGSLAGYECDLQTATLMLDKHLIGAAEIESFRRLFFSDAATATSWGVAGRGGYQEISYYEPTALSKQDARRGIGALGAFWSMFRLNDASIYSVTFNLERAVEKRKNELRCLAVPSSSGAFQCANGIIGAPGYKWTQVLGLEYRHRTIGNLAFALQLNRDVRNRITTVQLPLYFVEVDKKGLAGGVNLGWSSEDRKAVAGIFIGQSFSWFGER